MRALSTLARVTRFHCEREREREKERMIGPIPTLSSARCSCDLRRQRKESTPSSQTLHALVQTCSYHLQWDNTSTTKGSNALGWVVPIADIAEYTNRDHACLHWTSRTNHQRHYLQGLGAQRVVWGVLVAGDEMMETSRSRCEMWPPRSYLRSVGE